MGLYLWLTPPPLVNKEPDQLEGIVRYVIDGDTFILADSETRIRLWGVDAPEIDEAGYQQAKDALTQLVRGKSIEYTIQDIDKYGRTVARVYVDNDIEVNRYLIAGKYASEYCRFTDGFYGYCKD